MISNLIDYSEYSVICIHLFVLKALALLDMFDCPPVWESVFGLNYAKTHLCLEFVQYPLLRQFVTCVCAGDAFRSTRKLTVQLELHTANHRCIANDFRRNTLKFRRISTNKIKELPT